MGLETHCASMLVLDTETSGLSFSRDEIIEFAAAKLVWQDGAWVSVAEVD